MIFGISVLFGVLVLFGNSMDLLFPLGACYINIQDTEIATNLKLCVRNLHLCLDYL